MNNLLEVGNILEVKGYFPKITDMEQNDDGEYSYDVQPGEVIKILSYDKTDKLYKLLNLSLGEDEAWFHASEKELLILI